MSLTFATANGMPMMVMASSSAVTRWASASSQPSRMSQTMFPMNVPTPAVGLAMVVRPKGQTTNPAMRNAAIPNGMGDDQDARQDAGQDIDEPEPESGEHEPDDVADE